MFQQFFGFCKIRFDFHFLCRIYGEAYGQENRECCGANHVQTPVDESEFSEAYFQT